MGSLIALTAGRLEQDRRPYSPMDVLERPLRRVSVERGGLVPIARDVAVDTGIETHFSQLTQHHGAERRHVERRRAQRYQRFAPRLPMLFAEDHRDPLRKHRQCSARLLEL